MRNFYCFEKHPSGLQNISKVLLCSFLLLTLLPVYAQGFRENPAHGLSRNISAHILSENGLSQNTVHSIIQDSKGFMWFATEDGLNKYDGYNFTVYKNNPQDKNSISDNFIWTIFEDKKGFLWIGTNSGGLCKFDRDKETFTSYKNIPGDPNSLSMNNVRSIYEDTEGILWIGTEGEGLEKFDRKKNVFTHYKNNPQNPSSIGNNVILSIYEDDSGNLWIGHNAGLDKFIKSRNEFIHFSNLVKNNPPVSSTVFSICADNTGNLIAGTLNGLSKSGSEKNSFSGYLFNSSNRSRNRINILLHDKERILWAGTGSGLFMFAENKYGSFLNEAELHELNILGNNNVLSLYEDNSGLVWIGTAEEGLYLYNRERSKFRHFVHDPFSPGSLSYNTVRSIFQERDGALWIGTLGGGLNKLDPGGSKFIHFKNDPLDKNSLSDNTISAILKDKEGYLWIGTWNGGLDRTIYPYKQSGSFKSRFKNYRNLPGDPNSLSSNLIQAVFEDSDGILWIGTGTGLNIYDRKKDTFHRLYNDPSDQGSLSNNQVQSCIIEDRDGNLWIGTWGGLSRLTMENRKLASGNPSAIKFICYRFIADSYANTSGLSDDRIVSAYEDGAGNLWFGTYGGGLNKLPYSEKNSASPKFENFNMDDGLASNIIYGVLGDKNDNLWLSSDNGLTHLNSEKNIVRNYNADDGLQGNQFFWGAYFKGAGGELFFGGTNGYNSFHPEELKINDHVPPVFITNLQIFNKSVPVGEDSPLKKSIESTREIELSYNQNVFSFEFTALDFTVPSKNKYKYIMEGFDKSWTYSGSRRFVTYTNLDPGEYVFRIAGSNNDGIWNEKQAFIKIKILPPFWRTWWFIALAAILIISLVTYIVSSRVRSLLAIERLRSKLAADLHDNIGSGLTEISILSEVISKKVNPSDGGIQKSLKMISDTSRSLIDGMSDIVWLVNPKRDSLYDLILRLRDTYSELFSYTDISFRSENIKSLEKVSLTMEHRQHLYLIFKEAINNAISHSGCHEITLDASVKGKKLEMVLEDNGSGFCIDEISSGNGLSNMQNRAKTIGGELIISSNEGEGTTVRFEGAIL